jgi:pimeloyl-ACP methyl ester carboxylesterase
MRPFHPKHTLAGVLALAAAVLLLSVVTSPASAVAIGVSKSPKPPRTSKPVSSGRVTVDGAQIYYEVHGPSGGTPLVLLPGGGSTIGATYGRFLPLLARKRRIIAIEEQGHGRSTARPGPQRFETSAEDVAAVLAHLKIANADVFGFSNGASIALQVAIRQPALVRKLVFASSFTKKAGAQAGLWTMLQSASFADMPQPLKDEFLKVNPDTAALRRMHDMDLERMHSFIDVPDDQTRAVRAPALILLGDRDVVLPQHAVELSRLLPSARLLIVPGGHGDYLGEITTSPNAKSAEAVAALVEAFLDEEAAPAR